MNKILIFDLDGTLTDSAGGIANAVNLTRMGFGFAPLDEKEISAYIGDGAKKLLERACKDISLPVSIEETVKIMVAHYAADPLYHTVLYPGVAEGMKRLAESGWILTVLSNKPQTVSEKILAGLGIMPLLKENIGGGSGFPLKPAPDALFHILEKHNGDPANSFVIGDNHTDINAAANAGIKSIFCTYGLGQKADSSPTFEADDFTEVTNFLINTSQW